MKLLQMNHVKKSFNDETLHVLKDISLSVEKGEVTLKGDVRSREEKFRAEQIAESVSGVSDVTNNLRVKKRSRNADSSTRSGEDNRVDSQSESKSSSGNSGISPIAGPATPEPHANRGTALDSFKTREPNRSRVALHHAVKCAMPRRARATSRG